MREQNQQQGFCTISICCWCQEQNFKLLNTALPFLALVLLPSAVLSGEQRNKHLLWKAGTAAKSILSCFKQDVCAAVVCGCDCKMELPRLPAWWASWGIHHTISHLTDWDSPCLQISASLIHSSDLHLNICTKKRRPTFYAFPLQIGNYSLGLLHTEEKKELKPVINKNSSTRMSSWFLCKQCLTDTSINNPRGPQWQSSLANSTTQITRF